MDHVLDTAYASAIDPGNWPRMLASLSELFRCHFADAFARTQDFAHYRGVAHGLDPVDYQRGLLDGWVKRNVWGKSRPVRRAGDIVTTREMMTPAALRRSEMYVDYLHPRGLHEGLRFDIWVGEGWVQDISLLRPWSAGPFDATELRLARAILPHLQRAAAVARRIQGAEALATAGMAALDKLRQSAFLTDAEGRVLSVNQAGEALLAASDGMHTEGGQLLAETLAGTRALRATLGRAGAARGESGHLQLVRPGTAGPLKVVALPIPREADWTTLGAPAVLVIAGAPSAPVLPSASRLAAVFGFTPAEAAVAGALIAGRSVAEIAADTDRSVNTVRAHLARLMFKTGARRQGALVRVLMQAPPDGAETRGPQFA